MSMFDKILRRLGLRADPPPPPPAPEPPPASDSPGQSSAFARAGIFRAPPAPRVESDDRGEMSIRVWVPEDRSKPGTLSLMQDGRTLSGPWPAVCMADRALSARAGNPGANRLRNFGDTPTGGYKVVALAPAPKDALSRQLFGAHGVIVMRPLYGDAAKARGAGRERLLIHGGADHLAPTDGSIRIPNIAMQEMMSFLKTNRNIEARVKTSHGHTKWAEVSASDASPARSGWKQGKAVNKVRQPDPVQSVSQDGLDPNSFAMMHFYGMYQNGIYGGLSSQHVGSIPRMPDPTCITPQGAASFLESWSNGTYCPPDESSGRQAPVTHSSPLSEDRPSYPQPETSHSHSSYRRDDYDATPAPRQPDTSYAPSVSPTDYGSSSTTSDYSSPPSPSFDSGSTPSPSGPDF